MGILKSWADELKSWLDMHDEVTDLDSMPNDVFLGMALRFDTKVGD